MRKNFPAATVEVVAKHGCLHSEGEQCLGHFWPTVDLMPVRIPNTCVKRLIVRTKESVCRDFRASLLGCPTCPQVTMERVRAHKDDRSTLPNILRGVCDRRGDAKPGAAGPEGPLRMSRHVTSRGSCRNIATQEVGHQPPQPSVNCYRRSTMGKASLTLKHCS
eukprot:jgi/Botrbrau1/9669/Bobra.0201s0004.2